MCSRTPRLLPQRPPTANGAFIGGSFNAISCASPAYCVASYASETGPYVVTLNGSTWSSPRLLAKYQGTIISIACPAVRDCIAITDAGTATVLDGMRWSAFVPVGALTPAK
jgi:hypothetical protein